MTTTQRAREIQAQTGCTGYTWKEAVSRAARELDGDGPPRHLANAALVWAEILAEIHPDCSFVGVVAGSRSTCRSRNASVASNSSISGGLRQDRPLDD